VYLGILKMLRFKQFISVLLFEAKAEHFAHIGLDVNNPHHKDMLDMFNKYTHTLVKKNPNQYKSLDELHSAVKPHLDNLENERETERASQEAIKKGDAELIHHDPSKGVKIYKVKNQRGCHAVGRGTKWCVAKNPTGGEFKHYDPEGDSSYVMHFNKENGNLSRVGVIGVNATKPHMSGLGGNFQDKGNNTVTDSDWDMLRKKYKLDQVKELHGVRGIVSPEVREAQKKEAERLVNPNMNDDELSEVAKNSKNPYVHRAVAQHPNVGRHGLRAIAETDDPEVHRAIVNHPDANAGALNVVTQRSNDPEIQKTIVSRKDVKDGHLFNIAQKTDDPEIHRAIANHPNVGDHALNQLADSSNDIETLRSVAQHPETYSGDLYTIASKTNDPEVHRAIASHPNAGSKALDAIEIKSHDPEVQRAIANHPNAHDLTLDSIAEKSDDPEVHKAIANHPNASKYTLDTIASKTNDPEVQRAIANHPNYSE
jgi:hypothetical protein